MKCLLAVCILAAVLSASVGAQNYLFDLTVAETGGFEQDSNYGAEICIGQSYEEVGGQNPVYGGYVCLDCHAYLSEASMCTYNADIKDLWATGTSATFPIEMIDLSDALLCPTEPQGDPNEGKIGWEIEYAELAASDVGKCDFLLDGPNNLVFLKPGGDPPGDYEDTGWTLDVNLLDLDHNKCEMTVYASAPYTEGDKSLRRWVNGTFILINTQVSPYCPTCTVPDIPYILYKTTEPDVDAVSDAEPYVDQANDLVDLLEGDQYCDMGGAKHCKPGSRPLYFLEIARLYKASTNNFMARCQAGQGAACDSAAQYALQTSLFARRGINQLCLEIGDPPGCSV